MGRSAMSLDPEVFLLEAAEPFAFIRPLPGGLYEPVAEDHKGGNCVHQFAIISEPYIIDIVAWQWDWPAEWWLRLGYATLLGDHMFLRGRHTKLLLVETPAAYIENRGECACVLNWHRVDLLDAF